MPGVIDLTMAETVGCVMCGHLPMFGKPTAGANTRSECLVATTAARVVPVQGAAAELTSAMLTWRQARLPRVERFEDETWVPPVAGIEDEDTAGLVTYLDLPGIDGARVSASEASSSSALHSSDSPGPRRTADTRWEVNVQGIGAGWRDLQHLEKKAGEQDVRGATAHLGDSAATGRSSAAQPPDAAAHSAARHTGRGAGASETADVAPEPSKGRYSGAVEPIGEGREKSSGAQQQGADIVAGRRRKGRQKKRGNAGAAAAAASVDTSVMD